MGRRPAGRGAAVAALLLVTVLVLGIAPNVFADSADRAPAATEAQTKAAVERIRKQRPVTQAQREASAAKMRIMKRLAAASPTESSRALAAVPAPGPGGIPDYFGSTPNWAYSPLIRKFVDGLPGLGASGANNLGQFISVAKPDTKTYPGSDYYEIELRQFEEKLHSDLPPTTLRGYVQVNKGTDGAGNNTVEPDPIHYLGPFIVARKDRPVRIKFTNKLPTGEAGDLFIPVDESVMGAGEGPIPGEKYTQNRATLHLHGGISPWISDGTPHQWITPAGEDTPYPKGVSVKNVPDMPDPGDGSMTFFYTNQQSARLMFYHDHSFGITRLNVYAGEAAGYMITDETEDKLVESGAVPAEQIPLIIQDKTFVDASTIATTDPTWNWGTGSKDASTGIRTPKTGDLWVPHVYVPAQNPAMPDAVNPTGRWHYGPWFWPPVTAISHPPTSNPYYDPINAPWEPPLMPATPNPSMGMENYNDTPLINGTPYPKLTVQPKSYRMRILNAANDRFFNLQMYVADPSVKTADGRKNTEVKMVPAVETPGYPELWPTDGRLGGVPDPATAGPDWIQIGTEGGFLPAPAVVPNQPVTWVRDPTVFNAGNVQDHSLLLGSAERADVIVDFSKYAGKTIILYNDAPTAFPALDQRTDYFTGGPDLTETGGTKPTKPGYGPNTRTLMQITVAAATPAPAFDLDKLNDAFRSTNSSEGVFESGQNPLIVPDARYNSAYNQPYTEDPYVRIYQQSMSFETLRGDVVSIPLGAKAIQDEQGETFDPDYGRMSAKLGLERPSGVPGAPNFILYSFSDPATELLDDAMTPLAPVDENGVQIWKITHNGVDTHPVHFHLFDVQLINRVGWDGFIRTPDDNELGWKDTVRVSPLEDTIVALRPVAPKMNFGLWDSKRPLNPSLPIGSEMGFSRVNPVTGQPYTTPVKNEVVNFGWEYVWHCHILSHEEMDMMRPMSLWVDRSLAASPSLAATGVPGAPIDLRWTDETPGDDPAVWGDPANEIGFRIERATVDSAGVESTYTAIANPLANVTSYEDTTTEVGTAYRYRVFVLNAAGETMSNAVTVGPSMYFSEYMITPTSGVGGTIDPSAITTLSAGSDSATYTIAADPGYTINDVLIDGVSIGVTDTVKFTAVDGDHTLWALFAPDAYTIVPSSGAHGHITADTTQTVLAGSDITFNIEPDEGYHVALLTVDGAKVESKNSYTFNDVSANHTIDVIFELDTFTITPSAGPGGTISPDTVQWLNDGSDSATFTITPDYGYYIKDVKIDGVSQGRLRAYKFEDISADHTIDATFALKSIARFPGDRYTNTLKSAKLAYPKWTGVKHVVIASGDIASTAKFEAATAAGLAGAYDAPLLLSAKGYLRADVRKALKAMPNGLKVHVVGGKAGVSTSVIRALKKVPGVSSVDRVSGSDRYGTAVAVARRMKSVLGSSAATSTFVSSASRDSNLPDAVAASVVSASRHIPLLYTKTASVPAVTSAALTDLGLAKRYVIGDTAVVTTDVATTLGVAPGDRIGGPGWHATAAEFATRAKAEGWLASERVGFAYTMGYTTGIGGYLGKREAPFLGTYRNTVPLPTATYLTTNKDDLIGGYLFGPTSSVTETGRNNLLNLIK